jgi:hypothetical protein
MNSGWCQATAARSSARGQPWRRWTGWGSGEYGSGSVTHAIRIQTRVESDTLRIPELLLLVGKRVEVIVIEEEGAEEHDEREEQAAEAPRRKLGALRGMMKIPEDFDDPLPKDVLRTFEGGAKG